MNFPDPWQGIPSGTIVDEDLELLARAGQLITHEFSADRIRQACYELRASDTFWEISSKDEDKRKVLTDGYLLAPKTPVVSITRESISLPPDVLARILTKGQLFSVGILPVNTYADPGFDGRLGITLWNASNRWIRIAPDQPIAKIEFQRLPRPVARPYAGQHGYETEIWPIPFHLFVDVEHGPAKDQVGDVPTQLENSFGRNVANLSRDLDFYTRKVWIQLGVVMALFGVIFLLHDELSLFWSVLLGVVANLATVVVLGFLSGGIGRILGRR